MSMSIVQYLLSKLNEEGNEIGQHEVTLGLAQNKQ